ncbi:DUF4185 domain-containing protein [Persicitalea jodogahamensis]|nr:DUF4185 domain-containing protein [Persicitalea jodogahamensis]
MRVFLLLLFFTPNALSCFSQSLPYSHSKLIRGIEIDWSTHQRHAVGSDNFALTWADDGHLYGPWGDGGGFGGTNSKHRVSLGVARIEGPADNYRGVNRYGHADNSESTATIKGKSWGIVSVAGVLYMWVHPDQPGGWGNWGEIAKEARLHRSDDKGASWQAADWAVTNADGLVGGNILQYGRDYADAGRPSALNNYVYHYFVKPNAIPDTAGRASELHKPGLIYLARVPKDQLMQRESYEFYAGERGGKALWTKDLNKKKAVFQDENGVGMTIGISYNPGLKRYLLTTEHEFGERGNFGLFEGPTPWGPWATVSYLSRGKGTEFGHERAAEVPPNTFYWTFPTKWMDASGRELTMTFTGAGRGKDNDSFNTVKVNLLTN